MTEQPSKLTEEDIATLAAGAKAPDSLHRQVEAMIAEAERERASRPPRKPLASRRGG